MDINEIALQLTLKAMDMKAIETRNHGNVSDNTGDIDRVQAANEYNAKQISAFFNAIKESISKP